MSDQEKLDRRIELPDVPAILRKPFPSASCETQTKFIDALNERRNAALAYFGVPNTETADADLADALLRIVFPAFNPERKRARARLKRRAKSGRPPTPGRKLRRLYLSVDRSSAAHELGLGDIAKGTRRNLVLKGKRSQEALADRISRIRARRLFKAEMLRRALGLPLIGLIVRTDD